ncbi:MAG: hypothetical protein HOD64_07365 [Candidatus Cloacimonetes bacterium]|nr:hypothetical protein [Candidatus Cloacimonadota bacterium]
MKNKLLILAMYDLSVRNIAPARRMRAIINTFQKINVPFESISGSRKQRMNNALKLLFSKRTSDFSGVYIESTNSGMLFSEFLLLLKFRIKKIPISVYIRDIYPKYKQYWLWNNYRVIFAHLFWLFSYYVYKQMCKVIYVPSELMAQKLSLENYKILPPGFSSSIELGRVKQNSIFYAGGTGPQYDIECFLLVCEKLSKELDISVTFFCRKNEIKKIDKWQSESWFNIHHKDLEQLDFQPQIAVIPLTNSEYGNLAFPVKLIDYVSINTPMIVSNSTVTKNFVNRHEIGLVADSGNMEDYYTKTKIILENRELYTELLSNVYDLQKNPEITWEYKCKQIIKDLSS